MGDGLYGKYKSLSRSGGTGTGFGGFMTAFLAGLVVRFYGILPAAGLLAAHFLVKWPLWPVWLALGLWVLYVLLTTAFIAWANAVGSEPTPERPNKNPYSETSNDKYLQKR